MDAITKLAREVSRLKHRVNTQARTPQLAYSSLDNGAIPEYNEAGEVVAWYGQQIDGTHGAVVVNGPKPPTPSLPIADRRQGGLAVRWDGFFEGGQVRPMDLDFIRVLLADNDSMAGARSVGLMLASGTIAVNLPQGIYYVALLAESKPGLTSDPTDPVEVEVLPIDSEDIATGAITAPKLEQDLVLATNIIAGNPLGRHSRLDPEGFRSFAPPNAPGEEPRPAAQLGVVGEDDRLALLDASGAIASSMDSTGKISGSVIYANDGLVYQGRELSGLLADNSSAIIAHGSRFDNPGQCDNSTGWGIMEISTTLYGDRLYKVATNNILMTTNVTTNPLAEIQIRYTYSANSTPEAPTVSNGSFLTANRQHIGPGLSNSMKLEKLAILPTGNYRFLLFFKKYLGDGTVAPEGSTTFPIELFIEDTGPARPNLMIPTAGGGIQFTGNTAAPPPAAPAAQPRELYADAQSMQTYLPNGAPYSWQQGKMFQGQSPSVGWLRSMAMFNDLTPFLSGSEITGMQAYFYFDHWYENAGGFASIGVHGVSGTSAPGSYSGGTFATTSARIPKPGGLWIDIPSHLWNGFKTGTYRGLLLEAPNNLSSYGSATQCRLFFKYNK